MQAVNQGGYAYIIHDSGLPGPLPLVVFLHGIGERGDGTAAGIKPLEDFIDSQYNNIVKSVDTGFILIAPQLPSTKGEWENHYVDAALDYATKVLPVKIDQITIMGVSLGGGGVWRYISASIENAKKFNVAIPICGVGGWSNLKNVADAGLPVWAFHAQDDNVVGVGNTISAVDTINSFNPVIKAKKTIYPTGSFGTTPHYIWARVLDPNKSPGIEGETITPWQWMKQNTNIKHVAVATSAISSPVVTAPTTPISTAVKAVAEVKNLTPTTATLDGSKSEGKITWSNWEMVLPNPLTHPNVFPNWQKGGAMLNINNLKPNTDYQFKYTVNGSVSALLNFKTPATLKAEIFVESPIPTGKTKVIVRVDKTIEFL